MNESVIIQKLIQVGQMLQPGQLEYSSAEADIKYYLEQYAALRQPPVLEQTDVSGSFMCAHGSENRCKEQCYTCSEDEKCDVKYSYKHGIMDTWKFAEWIGQHYIRLHECWAHRFADQRNKDNWKDTGELWKLWWENYR